MISDAQAALADDAFYMCTYAGDALAKVGGAKAVPTLLAAMERHSSHPSITKSALKLLGEKAFPALAAHYRRADVKFDMAALLAELDCAAAVPDIKRDFDRREFSAYDSRYIQNFLERHADLWPQGEKVRCLACKKEAPAASMKGSGGHLVLPRPLLGAAGQAALQGHRQGLPRVPGHRSRSRRAWRTRSAAAASA